MIQISDKEKCCGCYACENVCPKKCIHMESDREGFWYPSVNADLCVECGLCEQVCPITTDAGTEQTPTAYAARTEDAEILKNSSSGGIFSELALTVLQQGGAVFGAAFEADLSVRHVCVETPAGLERLRGSKYVQGRIGNAYSQAETMLKEGRTVLFSGTPCQIGGLHSYLKKDYPNLITQDVVCHGVPSPMVWQHYVAYREKKARSGAVRMSFRHKQYGWKAFAVFFAFENDTAYMRRHREDAFMRSFLADMCLRPSCHSCAFKSGRSGSDITLADFWQVDKVVDEVDDDKGMSLVLVNSPKGAELLGQIRSRISCREAPFEESIRYNSAYRNPVKASPKRDAFLKCVQEKGFAAAEKFLRLPIRRRIRSLAGRIFRMVKGKLRG